MSNDSGSGETITPQDGLPPGTLWLPLQGAETRDLITHLELGRESGERIIAEATGILGKCIPPGGPADSTTGLVLGYVQSGKTMSFTTVAALARDNGYPLVIVITGISNPLLAQSTSRLEEDLRLQNNRKWRLFRNPKPENRQSIADTLADWRDQRVPDYRRKTVLITVLKNTSNLRNLNRVLQQLDLTVTPVLVIDDEADQAGLNTRAGQGLQSTTYQRLVALRQNLPHHAYLQYTATPQAPLLINIIDVLSPRFVELLTPGDEYVGGETFFEQNPNLVRVIPANEIPGRGNTPQDVPPSLILALRLFFLGVAAGFVTGDDQQQGRKRKNRSMLVHPSRETTGHGQFLHWIGQIRQQWLDILRLGQDGPERSGFVESFRPAYDDLSNTTPDLPEFDALAAELEYSIRQTQLLEVNAVRARTPQPDWKDSYSWILVGGQAMDRGFTVEGLTVTYMPRDMGVGNADTIEQRARFFGYKRRYLGLCRVFLEVSVRDAFQFYVEHERDIRRRLQEHRDIGRPLTEWRRAFRLDGSLSPTRRQVLDLYYRQDTLSDEWFWPKVPHGTTELLDANRRTVADFVARQNWTDSPGDDRRTADQIHLIADVPLRRAYEDLLDPLRLTEERDSQLLTGLLLQLDAYLQEHPDATCTVYQMNKGKSRLRSVNEEEEIPTLFQGANYADAAHRDMIYPGDEREREIQGVTIQIHTLEVRQMNRGPLIADNVPTIAVWIPRNMALGWLVQAES
jgi:hypothetical protein